MIKSQTSLLLAMALALLLAAGCSPEAGRVRGGGSGADVGNRHLGASMDIHGTTNPDYGEQVYSKAVQEGR